MKLTEWFPADVKPVRVGVYEIGHYRGIAMFQYWNGTFWGQWSLNVNRAYIMRITESTIQPERWRGIIKDKA